MAKNTPGLFNSFKGLWARGNTDFCPPDHWQDSRNNCFDDKYGFRSRDKHTLFLDTTAIAGWTANAKILRARLYKPNPPYNAVNLPRLIILNSAGQLIDTFLNTILHTNTNWKDFSLVNFFGRAYITPSDGNYGLTGEAVYVLTSNGGFRLACGAAPTVAMTAAILNPGGTLDPGQWIVAYAFETNTGFITGPSPRSVLSSLFPSNHINITNLPLGDTTIVARWVIVTKLIPQLSYAPFSFTYNGNDLGYPFYFAARIPDNTTTTYDLNFFEENLVDSADYLLSTLSQIPSTLGLTEFKGRMVTYGDPADPTLIRLSAPGSPENFSAISGFIITDPTDDTGVQSCVEWQNNLYYFKKQRGSMVPPVDGQEPSAWIPINFEKSIGTVQDGISGILDAKGATSEGFIIASSGALYYFNGAFQEPELSYKIRDLWLSINQKYFHLVQTYQDPINKRLYILLPLGASTSISHILYGDYRDGLGPLTIKWDLWEYQNAPVGVAIYEDYSAFDFLPSLTTKIINNANILTMNIGTMGTDNGVAVNSYATFAQVRFTDGLSQFNILKLRAFGPTDIHIKLQGQNPQEYVLGPIINFPTVYNREVNSPINLVSEEGTLTLSGSGYGINLVQLYGAPIWSERPR